MFAYNAKLALTSLKDRPSLTILMVAAIGIGLGLLTTMDTLVHQSKKIPLSHKSENLYLVQLDNREVSAEPVEHQSRMVDLTYQDSINLMNLPTPAKAQTFVWNSNGILNVEQQEINPLRSSLTATTAEFFSMFDVPFMYGGGWSKEVDQNGQAMIVLTRATNDYLFGGSNSVGQQVQLNTKVLTVVGVMDDWYLARKFYDRSYFRGRPDQAIVPSSFAFDNDLPRNARFDCWSTTTSPGAFRDTKLDELKSSECAWLTFWAEMTTPVDVQDYVSTVNQYVTEQQNLGRFPREMQNFYTNINQQIAYLNSRGGWQDFLSMIGYMFFAVCLINAVSILLAKFMRRTKEVSLRRALGAKKRTILQQHLLEVMMIGIMGGIVGIFVAYLGLQSMLRIALYASDYTVPAKDLLPYHQLDWQMIIFAFIVSVGCTLIVGLYPIWRICNISPASQLKAQ